MLDAFIQLHFASQIHQNNLFKRLPKEAISQNLNRHFNRENFVAILCTQHFLANLGSPIRVISFHLLNINNPPSCFQLELFQEIGLFLNIVVCRNYSWFDIFDNLSFNLDWCLVASNLLEEWIILYEIKQFLSIFYESVVYLPIGLLIFGLALSRY